MSIARARNAPELLDEPTHDARVLRQSLDHVAAVNRWLGGERALLAHVTPLLRQDRVTRLLDVGTGSADLPRAIVSWARRHARRVEIIATDIHPQMREIAREACRGFPEISIEAADAKALAYADRSFDAALLSLTLHHFDEEEQKTILKQLVRVSRESVIVNELLRSRLNYIGARLLALTFWRRNPLTRHDGPLSVLRAFTPDELLQLGNGAGRSAQVYRHFFQRIVMVVDV